MIVLGALVLLIALAPTLVSTGPVVGMILSKVNGDLTGRVEVDSVSLGWFADAEIRGIAVFDPQDRPVLTVRKVVRQGGLAGLLFNRDALGELTVDAPQVRLLADQAGRFGIEEAFAPRTPRPRKPDEPSVLEQAQSLSAKLTIRDGAVQMVDAGGQEFWVRQIDLDTTVAGLDDIRGELSAAVADGRVTVRHSLQKLVRDGKLALAEADGVISLRTEAPLSLAELGGLALGDRGKAAGTLTGQADVKITPGRIEGSYGFEAQGLQAAYDSLADLRPMNLALTGQTTVDERSVSGGTQLAGQSDQGDIADVHASWTLDRASLAEASAIRELLTAMLSGGDVRLPGLTVDAAGKLDLAGLARTVPALFAVRNGVRIEQGALDFRAKADTVVGREASATFTLSRIIAFEDSRRIEFDPIQGDLTALWPTGEPIEIPSARLSGDFGQASLQHQADQYVANLEIDLAPLQRRITALTEFSQVELSGQMAARLTITDLRRSQRKLTFAADGQGRQLRASAPAVTQQPLVLTQADFTAAGELTQDEAGKPALLAVSDLKLNADATAIAATGRYNFASDAPEDFELTVTAGDLDEVRAHLTALDFWPADASLTGSARLSAAGRYGTGGELSVVVDARAEKLALVHPAVGTVDWPTAALDAPVTFRTADRTFALSDPARPITLTSPWGQVQIARLDGRAEPLSVQWQAGLAGLDLARLAALKSFPGDFTLAGQGDGRFVGSYENGVVRLTGNEVMLRQLVLAGARIGRIEWPEAIVNAPLEYDTKTTRFKLGASPAAIATPWGRLKAEASGTLEPLILRGSFQAEQVDLAASKALAPLLKLQERHFTGMMSLSAEVHRTGPDKPLASTGELRIDKPGDDRRLFSDQPVVLNWQNVRAAVSGPEAGKAFEADAVLLSGEAAQASAKAVRVDLSAAQPKIAAAVTAAADLKRVREVLQPLLKDPEKLPALAGAFRFEGGGRTEAGKIMVVGDAAVRDLVVGEGAQAFRQEEVTLTESLALDPDARTIQVEKFAVVSKLFQTDLAGTVTDYTGRQELALQGRYRGDWAQATRLLHQLRPDLAGDIKEIRGELDWPLTVRGALSKPEITPGYGELAADAGVNWAAAEAYGLQIGPLHMPLKLAGGTVDIPETSIEANDGKIVLIGQVQLYDPAAPAAAPATPRYLLADRKQVLSDVAVTHEFSTKQLRHLNPALFYQPKKVSGKVSLTVEGVDLPLGEQIKTAGRIKRGRLDIRDFEVQPNDAFGAVLAAMGSVTGGLGKLQTDGFEFHMTDGRIHYDKFELVWNNLHRLRFSGWVGLDDTMELWVHVPVSPELLRKLAIRLPAVPGLDLTKLFTELEVPIPIKGGMDSMTPDLTQAGNLFQPMFEKALQEFLRGGAGIKGAIEDILPLKPPGAGQPSSPLQDLLEGLRRPAPGQSPRQLPGSPATQPQTRPAEDPMLDAIRRLLER